MPNEAIVNKFGVALSDDLQRRGAPTPWAFITIILQGIIQALQSCSQVPPAQVPAMLGRPSLLTRMIVQNRVRNELVTHFGIGAFYTHHGAAIVDSVIAVGGQASPEEFEALAKVQL